MLRILCQSLQQQATILWCPQQQNKSSSTRYSAFRSAMDMPSKLLQDKAPGEDNIIANILIGGEPIVETLSKFFNRRLTEGRVPSSWKNVSVVILHKKRDTADIKNYRPISLLPVMFKVFSHIISFCGECCTHSTNTSQENMLASGQVSPSSTTPML